MLPLTAIKNLFAYNYWARDRQLEVCATLSQEQLDRPLGNSFTSLRETLAHLLGAELIWLERLRGGSPASLPAADEFPTLAHLINRWCWVESDIREYLSELRESDLERQLNYTDTTGNPQKHPVWLALQHLANHQSYHRGQVTTLLRQLHVQPPAVDLLVADEAGLFTQVEPSQTWGWVPAVR
jgi:uncharacterized damage-inducible protein DinB